MRKEEVGSNQIFTKSNQTFTARCLHSLSSHELLSCDIVGLSNGHSKRKLTFMPTTSTSFERRSSSSAVQVPLPLTMWWGLSPTRQCSMHAVAVLPGSRSAMADHLGPGRFLEADGGRTTQVQFECTSMKVPTGSREVGMSISLLTSTLENRPRGILS